MSLVAGLVLMCPVCTRLIGNGWRKRITRQRSKGVEPSAQRISVHQLVCPRCRDAGRHPWNFRALPSTLCPFKHFLQLVRLAVFALGPARRTRSHLRDRHDLVVDVFRFAMTASCHHAGKMLRWPNVPGMHQEVCPTGQDRPEAEPRAGQSARHVRASTLAASGRLSLTIAGGCSWVNRQPSTARRCTTYHPGRPSAGGQGTAPYPHSIRTSSAGSAPVSSGAGTRRSDSGRASCAPAAHSRERMSRSRSLHPRLWRDACRPGPPIGGWSPAVPATTETTVAVRATWPAPARHGPAPSGARHGHSPPAWRRPRVVCPLGRDGWRPGLEWPLPDPRVAADIDLEPPVWRHVGGGAATGDEAGGAWVSVQKVLARRQGNPEAAVGAGGEACHDPAGLRCRDADKSWWETDGLQVHLRRPIRAGLIGPLHRAERTRGDGALHAGVRGDGRAARSQECPGVEEGRACAPHRSHPPPSLGRGWRGRGSGAREADLCEVLAPSSGGTPPGGRCPSRRTPTSPGPMSRPRSECSAGLDRAPPVCAAGPTRAAAPSARAKPCRGGPGAARRSRAGGAHPAWPCGARPRSGGALPAAGRGGRPRRSRPPPPPDIRRAPERRAGAAGPGLDLTGPLPRRTSNAPSRPASSARGHDGLQGAGYPGNGGPGVARRGPRRFSRE